MRIRHTIAAAALALAACGSTAATPAHAATAPPCSPLVRVCAPPSWQTSPPLVIARCGGWNRYCAWAGHTWQTSPPTIARCSGWNRYCAWAGRVWVWKVAAR